MQAPAGELSVAPSALRLPDMAGARTAVTVSRRVVGVLALAVFVYLSFTLVTGAAAAPSKLVPARFGGFPAWLRGPLDGVGLPITTNAYVVLFVGMIAAYLVALACVGVLRARWTLAAVALVHVLFLLGPPLLSADVMGYLDWARMGALHGLSPYAHDSGSVVSDAVYPFVRWDRFTSPYGPVFTLLSYSVVPLGLPASLWALKAIATLASLGICGLIWVAAPRVGVNRSLAVALYGLNPVVLVFALGGAHNDLLAMALALGGAVLALYGREATGGVMATIAVGVKASSGVLLPFLVLGARRRMRTLASVAACALAVALVGLIAFGTQAAASLGVLGTQQGLEAGTTVIAQLGTWFGWTGDPPLARAVAGVVLACVLVFLLWRTWRGAPWLEAAAWATLAVLVTTSWLLPWYVVWLMPLAALAPSRTLRVAAVAFSIFAVATRIAPIAHRPSSVDLRPLAHPGACLGSGLAGCPGHRRRTTRAILNASLGRGFKRASAAAYRMQTGRQSPGRVPYAKVRCHPTTTAHQLCAIKYHLRTSRRLQRHVAYVVKVDERGCFTATSRRFAANLPNRILNGYARDPRGRINHCP